MKLLTGLSQYLLNLPGISRDNMESFADLGKLIPTGQDLGHGYEIGRFEYDAVINIERCPAENASLLLSYIVVWLSDNDPDRDHMGLDDPEIDVTVEDEQTVFVGITVQFKESLFIVEDPDGPIAWDGRQWRVDDVPIDVAETLDKLEER